jgi:hypothetical protein
MSTPDINAEMLVGAAGWASGSQTWSGTIPAFTPEPKEEECEQDMAYRFDRRTTRQQHRE